jgi:hypothetical protein
MTATLFVISAFVGRVFRGECGPLDPPIWSSNIGRVSPFAVPPYRLLQRNQRRTLASDQRVEDHRYSLTERDIAVRGCESILRVSKHFLPVLIQERTKVGAVFALKFFVVVCYITALGERRRQ